MPLSVGVLRWLLRPSIQENHHRHAPTTNKVFGPVATDVLVRPEEIAGLIDEVLGGLTVGKTHPKMLLKLRFDFQQPLLKGNSGFFWKDTAVHFPRIQVQLLVAMRPPNASFFHRRSCHLPAKAISRFGIEKIRKDE